MFVCHSNRVSFEMKIHGIVDIILDRKYDNLQETFEEVVEYDDRGIEE